MKLARALQPLHLALALIVAGPTLGCDGAGPKPALTDDVVDASTTPELARVETTVSAESLAAGGTVDVSCATYDQFDALWPTELLDFEVLAANGQPAQGVTRDGDRLTFAQAGVYRVKCEFTGIPFTEDISPVTVTVDAGPAVAIGTYVYRTSLTAGDSTSVACTVKDASGNPTSAETVVQVPADAGITVEGRRLTFIRPGSFPIVCALADGSLVGDTPVTVTVSPGKLVLLRTTLSTSSIHPTEEVIITCHGEDAHGNTVPLEKVFTLPIDGIDWLDDTRLRVTSTRTGSYQLACTPKESWVKATLVPATLDVLPGNPVDLQLDLSPDRSVYTVGARVRCTATLEDAWGNPVPEVGDTLVTKTYLDGAARETVPNGDKATLDAEGVWTLTVATGAPWNLTATRTAVADASAPSIDITYPARGAMVTEANGQVTITGTVTDPTGGLADVRINGASQSLTPGTHSFPIQIAGFARHGLNTITVEATDVNGNTSRVAQSFMVAPAWRPAGGRFDDGIVAHLAKAFIDDGVRSPDLDDLTTIFTRVLAGMDFSSLIPSPVVTYAGYDVYLRNLKFDAPVLAVTPSAGALNLSMQINNLSVDVDADGFIDVGGDVTVTQVDIQMVLAISVVNGQIRVTPGTTVVDVKGLNIDVGWAINWLINFFEDDVADAMSGAFEDALRTQVPATLRDALAGLALDQSFEVPAFLPGMQPINLVLQARPTDVHLSTSGMDVDLGTTMQTVKRVPWSAPGSITRGGCFGTDNGVPAWSTDKRIGFGLSTDVLNQILFSVWWGGALEVSVDPSQLGDLSDYGVSDVSVTLSGRMPPILTDCLDADLHLQLGELEVDASLKLAGLPLDVGMIVAFETDAEISADANGSLSLTIGSIAPEDIVIDIVRVDSDLFSEDQETVLIDLLREQFLAKLLEGLADQGLADFPLPEIDLGAVSDDLSGQVISIHDVDIDRQRGYVMLQGNP
ncbi:MAG: hypothetical protein EP329_06555 [Deltaproteobacteria bacterium]|nr:MAG: hypothetical protein EP329_06555 [Deltaproteobacteria bacterium]